MNKLRVYRRAYEVSFLRIAHFVFETATNVNGMHARLQYTYVHRLYCTFGDFDFLTRNRSSRKLAATCKYAFRKLLLVEYMLILIITNYVV